MSRYVDIHSKEATHLISNLEPKWKPMTEFNGEDREELNSIAEAFLALPTADVVEVVRCKDCEYRNSPDCAMWYGSFGDTDYIIATSDDFYCSYGKRGDNDE